MNIDEAAFRSSLDFKGKLILLSAVFLLTYSSAISQLVRTWQGRDDYSHGFLVPFVSIYLVWHMRDRLKGLPIRPSIVAGSLITLTGILMLVLAQTVSAALIQQVSILVTIPGLVLLLLGADYLKALALPIAYLIFMVPVLDLILDMDKIHWPFQLFAATIAGKLLPLFNVPVYQHANYLELPNKSLEVANGCSGVRYLISIIALGIPLAYFTQKSRLKGLLLIVLAVMIGIFTNPVRILLIGLWSYHGGVITHGPLHIFQGLFISVIGFAFLFAAAWYLNRTSLLSSGNFTARYQHMDKPSDPAGFNRIWIYTIIVFIGLGLYLMFLHPHPVSLKTSLEDLPYKIGNWNGERVSGQAHPFSIRGADAEIFRIYRNEHGSEIKLQISYVEMQSADKNLLHYKLQGLENHAETVGIPDNSGTAKIGVTSVKEDGAPMSTIYWYNLNGRITPDRYMAKLIMAANGLTHGITNGAFVMISSPSKSGENAQILADEKEFAKMLLPILGNIL